MKKYMQEYIENEEKLLKKDISKKDIEELLTKISFFQHERFIHLIVMMFTITFTLTFLILSFKYTYLVIGYFIMLILSIFYIKHYYFLENSVQYLYKLYDKFNNKNM